MKLSNSAYKLIGCHLKIHIKLEFPNRFNLVLDQIFPTFVSSSITGMHLSCPQQGHVLDHHVTTVGTKTLSLARNIVPDLRDNNYVDPHLLPDTDPDLAHKDLTMSAIIPDQ